MPSGLTVELSANYRILGVPHKLMMLSLNKNSLVMTLINAPRSIKKFFIWMPLI